MLKWKPDFSFRFAFFSFPHFELPLNRRKILSLVSPPLNFSFLSSFPPFLLLQPFFLSTFFFFGFFRAQLLSFFSSSYSTDFGNTWVRQIYPETEIEAIPPPAAPDSIEAINIVTKKRNMGRIVTGATFAIEAVGAVPSSRTLIKFTQRENCFGGVEVNYTQVISFFPLFFISFNLNFLFFVFCFCFCFFF